MAESSERSTAPQDPPGIPVSARARVADTAKEDAAGRPLGPIPDFFIVGHPKCGTSALYAMLKNHPEIYMSDVKEPRYFASDERSQVSRNPPRGRPRTLEGYRAMFADAKPGQRVGDASPQYLRSHVAAAGIAAVQPDARIVAILREPASFLRSFHLQMVASKVEPERDFAKALALEGARREGRKLPRNAHFPGVLLYSDHIDYVEQLSRFHDVFPPENVLVLIYDDFQRDNEAAVRQILRLLNVDDEAPIPQVRTGGSKAVRSPRLKRVADAARMGRNAPARASRFGRSVSALTPAAMKSEAFRARWRKIVFAEPPAPDERLMRELRQRYKPEVVALSEYLGRDLVSLWGYQESALG